MDKNNKNKAQRNRSFIMHTVTKYARAQIFVLGYMQSIKKILELILTIFHPGLPLAISMRPDKVETVAVRRLSTMKLTWRFMMFCFFSDSQEYIFAVTAD